MHEIRLYATAGLVVAAGSAALLVLSSRKPRTTLPDLKGYVPTPLPSVLGVLGRLPLFVRKWMAVQMNAPRHEQLDARDIFSLPDAEVYEYEEVVPGKVWRVAYCFQSGFVKMMKAIGGPPDDAFKKKLLERGPENMQERLKKDLAKYEHAWKICDKEGEKGDWFKAGVVDKQYCMVAKLPSGGVLLYAPPRIHDDLAAWLDALGRVEYIVLGSSSHTTRIPGVAARYPNAKICGPEVAERKLKVVGMKSFDFKTSSASELADLNRTLKEDGVHVHAVDCSAVDEVLVVVHRRVFECDLVYAHCNGEQMCTSKEDWKSGDSWFIARILFYGTILASWNKMIPGYRFAGKGGMVK